MSQYEAITNANLNRKDIADYPIQFFLAGQDAPLNLTIFESQDDYDTWTAYKLLSSVNTFSGIKRNIYSGFRGYAASLISDNDPSWHQKTLVNKPATARFVWKHQGHIDSPWRTRIELLFNWLNQPQWKSTENPISTMVSWYVQPTSNSYTNIRGLPRFDYVSGDCISPKIDSKNMVEYKGLSTYSPNINTNVRARHISIRIISINIL